MLTSHIFREEQGIHYMPRSSRIISEMLPEILTMEKCEFLKSKILSKIFYSPLYMCPFVRFLVSGSINLYHCSFVINSVDADQPPHIAMSDLCLYYLSLSRL